MQLIPFYRKKKEKSDSELLGLYLESREPEVLGELYARYMHLVYGVCLKYFKEPEKSKDAVIQIYEKIHLEIHRHEVKNFKSWLYVVTKNHCLMDLRKKKPGETVRVSAEEEWSLFMENEAELHPVDRTPDEMPEQALEKCMERLKAEQRKCIDLFYFKNKSYREISGVLEMEERKVKSHIQNGKRNLKICLEEKK